MTHTADPHGFTAHGHSCCDKAGVSLRVTARCGGPALCASCKQAAADIHATRAVDAQTCQLTPGCTFPPHAASDHPCGKRHIPGSPCDYCGKFTPANGDPCWDCWTPITVADAKALFAAEGLSVDREPEEPK